MPSSGTLVLTVVATLMAVPLGLLAGIYLAEFGEAPEWRTTAAFPPTS